MNLPFPQTPPPTASMSHSGEPLLTLIHFGDLHVWRLGMDGDFAFKRLLGLANLALRRGRKFPETVARRFIERLAGEEADFLLFSGDLTTTSLRQEFEAGRQILTPLVQRWGERFITIPGNHDRYTPRATRQALFETFFLQKTLELPFARDLDAAWTLVGFDASVPRHLSSRGHIGPEALERLRALLDEQAGRCRRLIVLGHYPILYPPHHPPSWEHVLPQHNVVFKELMQRGVKLYLHGHVHRRWRVQAGGLTDLNCGSAGMNGSINERRPGYVKIRLNATGIESIEAHWLQPGPPEEAQWTSGELAPLVIDRPGPAGTVE